MRKPLGALLLRLADITDGLGFTLGFVEKRDSFGWAVGGWGGGEFDVFTAAAYDGDDALARKVYTGSNQHQQGFKRRHVRRLGPSSFSASWT